MSKKKSVILLIILTFTIFAIGLTINPIPQPLVYHDFADQRSLLSIPNAWNVLSNVLFALAGMWGIFLMLSPGKIQFNDNRERWPWFGIAVGLILTALGSSYYHWAPDNDRLMWDRLPMTIIFMSLAAALITERINAKYGLWLYPALLAFGFYSVIYWHCTEQHGVGDLRLYFGVQAFIIVVVFLMIMIPSSYNKSWDLAVVLLLFGLARFLEIYDQQIATITDERLSGHTLKHMAGALAGFWLIRMIWKRKLKHI